MLHCSPEIYESCEFAELEPVDPVVEENSMVSMNCTLQQNFRGHLDSSQLYFKIDDQDLNVSSPYVEAVSDVTIQLHYPHLAIHKHDTVYCYGPDGMYLDATVVFIASKCKVMAMIITGGMFLDATMMGYTWMQLLSLWRVCVK